MALMKFDEVFEGNTNNWIENRTIFLCLSGSHAYGLNTPESDMDYRGVCIPPAEFVFGLQGFEQQVMSEPDTTIYGIRKFVKLARDCNPNIIELLFVDEKNTIVCDEWFARIKAQRDLFLSQRAVHTFSGYAMAQLKKIRSHKAWIDSPPTRKPDRADTGYVKAKHDLNGHKYTLFDEGAYRADMRVWEQYQNWIENRNPDRAELEKQYYYDTKHAMHLIRLLRMGMEILVDGQVNVMRPDRGELLAIRQGAWSYDEVVAYAEDAEKKMQEAVKKTSLPKSPKDRQISGLLVDVSWEYMDKNG